MNKSAEWSSHDYLNSIIDDDINFKKNDIGLAVHFMFHLCSL